MIFEPNIFAGVMRNQFPKMTLEEIHAITERAQYLITYFSGFIEGRRSVLPPQLFNVEASAEYVALAYMVGTMDKTGSKHYMSGLADAAVRSMRPDGLASVSAAAPAAPVAPAAEEPAAVLPFPVVPPVSLG